MSGGGPSPNAKALTAWEREYIRSVAGKDVDDLAPDERDSMVFAAKMKSKAVAREPGADRYRSMDDLRARMRTDPALLASVMEVMREEAELNKGLTKEQQRERVKMEKIGWERDDRHREARCRWYDCDSPAGVKLQRCPCRQDGVVYCSPECQM
ncbi:putative retrograde regulation protein 2 [Pseudohyphozyma bogoriensis]|nr:putative retrograde regulation protein 2 [Pseudohyphozyma bogoriensis]